MKETERKLIFEDFRDFEPPEGFAGGCMQTRLTFHCVHLGPDGKIKNYQQGCPKWFGCKETGGKNYKIK